MAVGGGGARRAAAVKRAVMRSSESYRGSCKSKGGESAAGTGWGVHSRYKGPFNYL